MSYFREKIPVMEPSLTRDFMERLLEMIKTPRYHCLTT